MQSNGTHDTSSLIIRLVCSHPFLFDWPSDPKTRDLVVDDQLVNASGKMMVLERLLDELFARGHKVLIFSQFKIGLNIIEDWATEFKGWPLCRIDGETSAEDRREQMRIFQNGGDAPDAPRLFLLTTRAGGQGINLTAADTVIFYDQDWNPQMDAQAADRAHRIGQTKPVLIFRLISRHTVEARIMERATAKRQLEALVIAKGKFRAPTAAASKAQTAAEAAAALLELEAENIEVVPDNASGRASVLSDADLDALLDRSPEVYAGRGKGWAKAKAAGAEGDAFAVFEAPVDTGNSALANMLGEDELPS
jgi:ATP-dependent DNA helicase